MNRLTRRQFMQLSTVAAIQLSIGCSPKEIIADGKPTHHLTTGFRNYPIAPKPATPGVGFLFRRIRDSYDKPEIPRDHILEASLVIATLDQCTAASSMTWIGHSSYLLRIENKHLLLDPFFSDIAIVPIGAYDPANVMQPVHTNPEEAIQVANDVKADLIIPSHWGTIALTDEAPFEPVERYRAFANRDGIGDGRAVVMKIGETRVI